MKRKTILALVIPLITTIVLAHNNCSDRNTFSSSKPTTNETVIGNPITRSTLKVVGAICQVVNRCFSEVSVSSCQSGVLATDGVDASLGLPTGSYSSTSEIVSAEQGGNLFGSSLATEACTISIENLNCSDPAVQSAYNASAANPYSGAPAMIPSGGACPTIFTTSTYFVSPSGSDTNDGTSESRPWLTFGKIFNSSRIVKPGDTIVLLDGIYAKSTTGFPDINCTTNANSGTATEPVTLKAKNERLAFLKSDGSVSPIAIRQCAFWNIEGIRTETADLPTSQGGKNVTNIGISMSSDIVIKRTLSANSNRYFNVHIVAILSSKNVLAEEAEAYGFHRNGFSVWKSHDVIIRRSYANMRGRGQLSTTCSDTGGDVPICNGRGTNASTSAFSFNQSSNSIAENSISEHGTEGFGIGSGTTFDGQVGGMNNKFLGNISFNDAISGQVRLIYAPYQTANNLYKDFVSYGAWMGSPLRPRGASELVIENATIMNSTLANEAGILADQEVDCSVYSGGCSITIRNTVSANHTSLGFLTMSPVNWLIEYSNAFNNSAGNYSRNRGNVTEALNDSAGNVQNSLAVAPTLMGLGAGQCLVWVPSSSNMKGAGKGGADIGANILYRYENGTLTSQPLWDRTTGEFPRGAIVAGMNDTPGDSLFDIHTRLNVNRNGCPFP
jgi:hypothetical protein